MKKVFLIVFFYLIQVSFVNAQTLKLGNQNFVKEKNKWFVVDKYNKYEVNERSITVKLKENVSESALNALNINKGVIIERSNDLGYIDLLLPEGSKFNEMFTHFSNSGIFESVEVNSFGERFSNDPGFSSQYYLSNANGYPSINASLEAIGYFENGSTNPVIAAVIDDGVDYTHGDLNMITGNGWNYIDGSSDDTYPYDSSDHGTAIAGIIAAKTDNGNAVAGVAGGDYPNLGTKIMSLRIGKDYWGYDQGSWAHLHMYDVSVIDDAIIYAADHGAKIINMSFGCDESSAINSAISYAHNQKGVTIVAAVGNSDERQGIAYPASNMYVIAVGGIRASWANYGSYGTGLDLVAPAADIYTTLNGNYNWGNAGWGTSFSAPQVAGVAALLLSHNQNLLHIDVENILKKKANRNYGQYDQLHDGSGILDAMGALDDLDNPSPEIPQNMAMTAVAGNHPIISWSAVSGATQYKVYRANSATGRYGFSLAGTTTSTSWTDNTYTVASPRFALSTNYYRVTAMESDYESITSAEVSCGTNATNKKNPGIEQLEPLDYSLESNYPNPFNPTTSISYTIKEMGLVTLKIFDVLGREVSVLVNEIKEPGKYSINFDASKLSSGVYIYLLNAGNFTSSKKMILTK